MFKSVTTFVTKTAKRLEDFGDEVNKDLDKTFRAVDKDLDKTFKKVDKALDEVFSEVDNLMKGADLTDKELSSKIKAAEKAFEDTKIDPLKRSKYTKSWKKDGRKYTLTIEG